MKLSIGIVGLPNVGKSLLFKTLTKQEINVANYPFATIDPNVGVVAVPDERLDKLTKLSKSKKTIPAVVEFYDIAGLVRGAYKGEGLGNQFLSHIRDVAAIVEVVRCFESAEIIHVEEKVNPIRDLETINAELIFKDLDGVEKRLAKLEGEARSGDKQKAKDFEILKKIREELNNGNLLFKLDKELLNEPIVKEMNLLAAKPQIYLLNGAPEDVSDELKARIKSLGADYLIINLAEADSDSINKLIQKAYEILDLISFLTTGEDETRAWTIRRGAKAPEAAGEIHTDFEKKFIRAETVNWQKLIEAGSWTAAKQKGWLRLEGKDYVVQDGDVLEIRHG
ncbi:MAG: redox-regulated ATPase YchF [Candidatus Paceibacterota bacterium]